MTEQEIVLREWAAEWFRIYVEGKLAPNTEGGYRNLIFNHIIPRLGGVALTDLSEKRIRTFYRKLSKAGLNDRSVWCVHLLLRRILDEACREGLIPLAADSNAAFEAGQDEKNCQPCWAIQEFL